MVTAFELDDLVATGEAARKTDGVHGGFGSAIGETNVLYRITLDDLFGEFALHLVRHAIHGAALELLLHGLHHRRMRVPRHDGAETEREIDVIIAIEVAQTRPLRFRDEQRIRLIAAEIAGYAERHERPRFFQGSARLRGTFFVDLNFFL